MSLHVNTCSCSSNPSQSSSISDTVMIPETHATSRPPLDNGSRTAASDDMDSFEALAENHKAPGSHDTLGDYINDYMQLGCQPTYFDDFGNDVHGLNNMSAQFDGLNGLPELDIPSKSANISRPYQSAEPYRASQSFDHQWSAIPQVSTVHQQPTFHAPQWYETQSFQQPLNFQTSTREPLNVQMPPTSQPFQHGSTRPNQGPSDHSLFFRHNNNVNLRADGERPEQDSVYQEDLFMEDRDRERSGPDVADPCYAQLLYQCLRQAPDHTLSLKELYGWIAQHSQKAKDSINRGWQNSVRHNLSMNAAFARVPHGTIHGSKKPSQWRLTEDALRDGVISTTRYRKDPKRKAERRAVPALNRQASGARGGRATRDATRHRLAQATHQSKPSQYTTRSSPDLPFPSTPAASPYFVSMASANIPLPLSASRTPTHPATPLQHAAAAPPPSALGQVYPFLEPPKPYLQSFELFPLNHSQTSIFGDHDPELLDYTSPNTPDTPSLMTEASFMTDDNILPSAAMTGSGNATF